MQKTSPSTTSRAFTLVELLVVIAIIGILMAMTLPAIQSSRESGRRTQCRNNIKNQSAAALQHISQQGFFPTAGWGWNWVGDADRGFNRRQVGGWQYNILPYMEEQALHDLGKGQPDASKKIANGQRMNTPIPMFYCPTRRRPETFTSSFAAVNSNAPGSVARSDYAGNGGSNGYTAGIAPDTSYLNKTDKEIDDQFTTLGNKSISQNGPMFARSEIKPALIRDGLSKTYLLGERNIRFDSYSIDTPGDDDQAWGIGYDRDVMRTTAIAPTHDTENTSIVAFGSAHLGAFNMAMCDGSVKSVTYEIDPAVHKSFGDKADGGPTDLSALQD